MTPISEVTNEELDRYIAELRGWKTVEVTSAFSLTAIKNVWINPLGYAENLPHPTTDPRYAMELLKEMPFHTSLHNYGNELDGTTIHWSCIVTNLLRPSEVVQAIAYTPERAISEAYAQWKGEK